MSSLIKLLLEAPDSQIDKAITDKIKVKVNNNELTSGFIKERLTCFLSYGLREITWDLTAPSILISELYAWSLIKVIEAWESINSKDAGLTAIAATWGIKKRKKMRNLMVAPLYLLHLNNFQEVH